MFDYFEHLAAELISPLQTIKSKHWIEPNWSQDQHNCRCGHTERLTVLGNHSEGDNVAGILDKLNNVIVRELNDGAPVDRWDTISDVQQAAAVGGAAFNDPANFVWNDWNGRYEGKWDIETQIEWPLWKHGIYWESQHNGGLRS